MAHIQTDKQLFLSGTHKAEVSDEQCGTGAPAVMRKQMTRVFEEQLIDRYDNYSPPADCLRCHITDRKWFTLGRMLSMVGTMLLHRT